MEVGGEIKVHAPGDTRRRHWIQLPSFPFNLIACKCHARKDQLELQGLRGWATSIESRRTGIF